MLTDVSAAPEIVDLPDTIYVEADEAAIQLSATLNGIANVAWTTPGDGSFSDLNSISSTYTFGVEDIANEEVALFISIESDCGSNGEGVHIILIDVPCPVLDLFFSINDLSCNGGDDGTVSVNANNGTPPYVYNWSNGGMDSTIIDLIAGDYTVTVTDTNDCSTIDSTTLNEPNPLIVTISVDDNLCFGQNEGRIVFEMVEGGTMPYSYSIDGINFFNQTEFNSLSPGIYATAVRDVNGCMYEENATIGEAAELSININLVNNISCADGNDGIVAVAINEGNPPYSYNWSNGETNSTIIDLVAGDYIVTVTDANDCSTTDSTSLTEPNLLIATISAEDNPCIGENEGRIVFETVEGGTPPYSYSIDGINFSNQTELSSLLSSTYPTMVQDANGCIYEENVAIEDEGDALYVDLGADATVTLGDSLTIIPEYNLIAVDIFIWTGIDCVNCQEVIVTPIESQFITLTIFDTNGCSATDSIFLAVSVDIYVPNSFSPNFDGINDQFYPFSGSDQIEILEFSVFNRWGSKVYENKNFTPNTSINGWDGTFKGEELNSGVFAWYLRASINGQIEILKGDVVLVR